MSAVHISKLRDVEMTGPAPTASGLSGRCPRCGEGHLFAGVLMLAPRCGRCRLDYSFADAGDGPAVFAIFILGFLVCGLALWVEFTFAPPLWLHAVVWLPVTALFAVAVLRPLKGVLVALQYANAAREGRLVTHGAPRTGETANVEEVQRDG